MPAPSRPARGAGAAADCPVESRRLHARGDRCPARLRAAHRRAQGKPNPPAVETRVEGTRAMSSDPPTAYEHLTPEQAAEIDAVCDRFEQAWKAIKSGGPIPQLGSYLDGSHGPHLEILSQELAA